MVLKTNMACDAELERVQQSSHREKLTEGGAYVGHGKSLKHPSHHMCPMRSLQFSDTAVDT